MRAKKASIAQHGTIKRGVVRGAASNYSTQGHPDQRSLLSGTEPGRATGGEEAQPREDHRPSASASGTLYSAQGSRYLLYPRYTSFRTFHLCSEETKSASIPMCSMYLTSLLDKSTRSAPRSHCKMWLKITENDFVQNDTWARKCSQKWLKICAELGLHKAMAQRKKAHSGQNTFRITLCPIQYK